MIDRDIKTPLYIQVYELIIQEIDRGIYRRGDMLPPEKELALRFEVDRQTVRRSLELLVDEGIVEKRAGVGSFVKAFPEVDERNSETGTVVFILPGSREGIGRIAEPFNAKLFSLIEEQCRGESFNLTYTTANGLEDLNRLPPNVVGVFAVSHVAREVVDALLAKNIATLVIKDVHPSCISITEDSFLGALNGVKHLIALGHRCIAYIGGIRGYITSEERFTGYMRSLIDSDIPWRDNPQVHSDWTFDGGFKSMQKILREWDPIPTAVFAANDMMALGTIHALQSANLKVPEDVSVIGFDNIDQCTYSVPQLTTVSVDIGLTAKVAAANLFRLIRTRSQEAYKIIIPTELILRRSTMPLAVVHRKKEPVC